MRKPSGGRRTARLAAAGFVILFVLCSLPAAEAAGRGFPLLQAKHAELREQFHRSLSGLVAYCDEHQLADLAAEMRELSHHGESGYAHVDQLPSNVLPDLGPDLSVEERYARTQFRKLRDDYARELYLLSRNVLHAGYPSFAFDLVREVAYVDSDHRSARQLLGFVRYGDEWVTPFAARMLRRKYVEHDEFGWLPQAHVERYERGERYVKGRWVTAEQEAAIRRDFRHAWEVRTEHFLIRTNHSLDKGVELSRRLEDFYGFFFQTFAGFFNTPDQMKKLFDGGLKNKQREERPYEVNYYATRQEYIDRLKGEMPQIAITNGLYLPGHRATHFFHNDEPGAEATLYHEATHQLFYETHWSEREIGFDSHFWILEGIACYMESFTQEGDRTTLGDPTYIRFAAARHRLLNDDFYVPLGRFASFGMHDFQGSTDISRYYSQASGLAHFFMHYDGGRYRDALIEHLSQLYSPDVRIRSRSQSLEELTETSYQELDGQYLTWCKEQDRRLAATTPTANELP